MGQGQAHAIALSSVLSCFHTSHPYLPSNRRALLQWDKGKPARVLMVKKQKNEAATEQMQQIGMSKCGSIGRGWGEYTGSGSKKAKGLQGGGAVRRSQTCVNVL